MSRASEFRETIFGRPNTVKAKLSLFDNHIAPYIASCSTGDQLAQRAIQDWKDNGLSMGTVKMLFVLLKGYIKFNHNLDVDTKKLNFQHFSSQQVTRPKIKVWTVQQVLKVFIAADENDQEMYDIITVALGTGMRKGELFALTWGDVDIINGTIEINKSLDTETGIVGPTKTKQSRLVQMNSAVAKVMEKGYTPGKEGDRCFRTFDPNRRLARLCVKAKVPRISFHDLRHTFATTCLEKGKSPKWVSATLGHAKLTTTLDVYWQHFQEKVDLEGLYE